MNIYIKSDREWLYPDEDLCGSKQYANEKKELHTAIGSDTGFQLLVNGCEGALQVSCEGEIKANVNILRDVLVNYNSTGEGSGFKDNRFVYHKPPHTLPLNCTRKAPFRVYDAYKPYEGEAPANGKIAFYICFDVNDTIKKGVYHVKVTVKDAAGTREINAVIRVYGAKVSGEKKFSLTNWFCLKNMARFHNVPLFCEEHFRYIEKYADAMLRMRQTHFWITTEYVTVTESAGGYQFDFSLVERLAKLFFDKGFRAMEFGQLGMRKRVFHKKLSVLQFHDILVDSAKGKDILESFLSQWAAVVEKNNWHEKIIYHLADEPDEPLDMIPDRRKQYDILHSMLHKYFPAAAVCEAVKTAQFSDYIDIMVPLSETYEKNKGAFDRIKSDCGELWFYVCCVPDGSYCQRFLDNPLISSRVLFWAAAKYAFTGFLHWGFNLMEEDQDPFEQTNQFHTYGDGVCLPAGDSHIVYPDGDTLYYSMRLEAGRKGIEDLEMLNMLKESNAELFEGLIKEVSPSFIYTADEEKMNEAYIGLLTALENDTEAFYGQCRQYVSSAAKQYG